MSYDLSWNPPVELSSTEQRVVKRTLKKRKLFAFLREIRHELFNEEFQQELAEMYRQTGSGKPPVAPALMAMAVILQKYAQVSDNEAVELTVFDKRWQMVLDCLNAEHPIFSLGAFFDFRMRLMATDMDQRLLERTIEFARLKGGFSTKALRAAFDSSPLEACGRVEDTVNLLAHAAKKAINVLAQITQKAVAEVAQQSDASIFCDSSIKAALDIDWSEPEQKKEAVDRLYCEVECLDLWLKENYPQLCQEEPLLDTLQTLDQIIIQDLEISDDKERLVQIRREVAKDRRISIEDKESRHGRKSKKKRFDGYKRHIMRDLDERLILTACTTSANESDAVAVEVLLSPIKNNERELRSVHVDRQYLHSKELLELEASGVDLLCRAPVGGNKKGMLPKRRFEIDVTELKATCPGGQTIPIELGHVAEFGADECDQCLLRGECTTRERGKGRTIQIHENEELYQRLRVMERTKEGRAKLRERVGVEHGLAHISQRQGNKARYKGARKNTFDLRIVCAIQNLERAQAFEMPRVLEEAA